MPPPRRLKLLHKVISFLFSFSFISSIPNKGNRQGSCTYPRAFLCLVVTAFLAAFTIHFSISVNTTDSKAGLALLVFLIIHRCALSVRYDKIERITRHLLRGKGLHRIRNTHWVLFMGIAVIISSHALKLACYFATFVQYHYSYARLKGEEIEGISRIFDAVNAVINTNLVLSVNAFGMAYAMMCVILRLNIMYISRSVVAGDNINYEWLLESFLRVKRDVEYVDSELSFLVFVSVIYNGALMYFAILSFKDDSKDLLDLIFMWLSFVANCISNIIMIISAAFVKEESKELWEIAQTFPESKQRFLQRKFMTYCAEGVTLTFWKLVPIQRVLILTNFGTVFTYILLLDGL